MSQSLFPTPAMPNGSYTWPITKYPEFATIIRTPAALRGEVTRSLTLYPIWHFQLDFAFLLGNLNDVSSAVRDVVGFHMAMRGSFDSWLFNDPYDNSTGANPVAFAAGDASTTAFQLTRPVGGGTDIVQNVTGAPSIYVAGALKTSGVDYTIGATGVVTFTTPPANLAVLSWSGNFYFRCRFKSDSLQELKQMAPSIWEIATVEFRSVIL